MELIAALIYFGGAALCIAIASGGVAIGQGYAGGISTEGSARQTLAQGPVRQSLLIGCAFLESGAVFSLIVSILTLFAAPELSDYGAMTLGIAALSMGLIAGVVGLVSGAVVSAALQSIARQPVDAGRIMSLMLIAQILLEAPMVFMFILTFLVKNFVSPDMSLLYAIQLMGGCLVLACGAIGPAIGQATFCRSVCEAVGLNISMYGRIFSFSFIVQAMIETPIIFSLLVCLMLMFSTPLADVSAYDLIGTCVGVVCATSFGSAGAAIGSGTAASRAVMCMAQNEEGATGIARLAIFCQAIIDTAVIYSLIISVLLIKTCM